MKRPILIIDTRAGNLYSLKACLVRLGYEVVVANRPDDRLYDAIVIPGQGRFGTVMNNLSADGWLPYLEQARLNNQLIFGICVGMQIFFDSSKEDPDAVGLGWLKGKAQALNFPKKPMVGWAELCSTCWPQAVVYFVNSYALKQSEAAIATCSYGEDFCAAVAKNNVVGVQFHPEKSGPIGEKIVAQILSGTFQLLAPKQQGGL